MLEEQEQEKGAQKEKRKFCGVWVVRKEEGIDLKIMTRNVNEEALRTEGKQRIPRYINARAWTSKTYKKALLIGNLLRISRKMKIYTRW